MSSRLIYTILFLLFGGVVFAQTTLEPFEEGCDEDLLCQEFDLILQRTLSNLEQGKGGAAYSELKALEACTKCPEHRDNLDAISQEIIRLFQEQAQRAEEQNKRLNNTVAQLESRTEALNAERAKVSRQLAINQEMTRGVLVNQYMRQARAAFEQGNAIGINDAIWLTDFTYHYVDSTHHEVKRMQYDLLYHRILDELDLEQEMFAEEEYEDWTEVIEDEVKAVAWSPDEQWLAVGTKNGQLLIFTAEGEKAFIGAEYSTVTMVNWSSDGQSLVFQKNNYELGLLSLIRGSWEERPLPFEFQSTITAIAWSPSNEDLAVATGTNEIFTWDLSYQAAVPAYLGGHDNTISSLAWSPDEAKLVSCDHGGNIAYWNMVDREVVYRREPHSDYARAVDWHPNGDVFISAGDDGLLIQWDTLGEIIKSEEFPTWILSASYSPSGAEIGLTTLDLDFFRYDIETGERTVSSLPPYVTSAAWKGELNTGDTADNISVGFDSDSKFTVPISYRASEILNDPNGTLNPGLISDLKWSSDGQYLAYSKDYELVILGPDRILHIDLGGAVITDLSWHPGLLSGLPNSNMLATVSSDGKLYMWDVITGNVLRETDLNSARAIDWSPNGKYIAVGNDLGEALLFDEELIQVGNAKPHSDFVRDIRWSPNGRYLATASDDQTAVIIDVQSMQELTTLSGHEDWLRSVIWTDNNHLVTGADDDKAIYWEWNQETNQAQLLQVIDQLNGYHHGLSYFPLRRGGMLAIGTDGSQVGIWRNESSRQFILDTIYQTADAVYSLDWHPKGSGLTHSAYGTVPLTINRIGEVGPAYEGTNKPAVGRKLEEALQGPSNRLETYFYFPEIEIYGRLERQVAWSPNEQWMAAVKQAPESSDAPYRVDLINVTNHEVQRAIDIDSYADITVSFSPNSRYLAIGLDIGEVILLDTQSETDTLVLRVGENLDLVDWCWSPNSNLLATLDHDSYVHIFNLVNGSKQSLYSGFEGAPAADLSFYPKNDRYLHLASSFGIYELDRRSGGDGRRIYEPLTFDLERTAGDSQLSQWLDNGRDMLYMRPGYAPVIMTVAPGTAEVKAEIGEAENAFTWSVAGGILHELERMPLEKGQYAASELEYPQIWSLEDGESLGRLPDARRQVIEDFELSPDGRYLMTIGSLLTKQEGKYDASYQSYILIWDLALQTEVLELPAPALVNAAFSPKGNYLALRYESGKVMIWPMDCSLIADYFLDSGKDRYLRQLSALESGGVDIITDWELESGINLREDANNALLKQREEGYIRQKWSSYYAMQAWFVDSEQEADNYFDKAVSMHTNSRGRSIRGTALDTTAMVEVLLEHAYYDMYRGAFNEAKTHIRSAQRLRPASERIAMTEILMDWQAGNKTSLIEVLWSAGNEALFAEVYNWTERDLRLNDMVELERHLAVYEESYDPDLVNVKSRYELTLPDNLPQELRQSIMRTYYGVNIDHPSFQGERALAKRQFFLNNAVEFYKSLREEDPEDEELVAELSAINYELQKVSFQKGKMDKALDYAQDNLILTNEVLVKNAGEEEYQRFYLDALAEVIFVSLQKDPSQAASLRETIVDAREQYPNIGGANYLLFQLAHCELVLNKKKEAYHLYFRILQQFGSNTYTIIEQTEREVSPIAPEQWPELQRVLKEYQAYATARQEFDDNEFSFEEAQEYYEDDTLVDVFSYMFERASERYEAAQVLLNEDMIPVEEMLLETSIYNDAASTYAHVLLYTNSWKDLPEVLERVEQYIPKKHWLKAIEAVVLLEQGDWPQTEALLRDVALRTNDGFGRQQYDTLGEYLLDLPEAVQQSAAYQAHAEDWRRVLE